MDRTARFDDIYRSRLAAGLPGWTDDHAVEQVPGHVWELLRRSGLAHTASGMLALELGSGTGALSRELARAGFAVLGLDISPTAVAVARLFADYQTELARRMEFAVHDVTLPLPELDGRFDVVLDGLLLHCLATTAARAAAVRFATDALKLGGFLLVMTVCGDPRRPPAGSVFDPDTRRLMTGGVVEGYYDHPADLAALLGSTGLTSLYSRIVPGNDETAHQDLYLAVLRREMRADSGG
jgi:SAM-dependent methyltransferase